MMTVMRMMGLKKAVPVSVHNIWDAFLKWWWFGRDVVGDDDNYYDDDGDSDAKDDEDDDKMRFTHLDLGAGGLENLRQGGNSH